MLEVLRHARCSYGIVEAGENDSVLISNFKYSTLVALLLGQCEAHLGENMQSPMRVGELIFLPKGRSIELIFGKRSMRGVQTLKLYDNPSRLFSFYTMNPASGRSVFLFASFVFEDPSAIRLMQLLPPVVTSNSLDSPQSDWLNYTSELLSRDCPKLKSQYEQLVPHVADIMMGECVRLWLERNPQVREEWIATSKDRQISSAISLIKRDPERPWTVGSLAAKCAMSRSSFAKRFKEVTGKSPIDFLTQVRMNRAVKLLESREMTMSEVARRSGYSSETAFSRAFLRYQGILPSVVRLRVRAAPPGKL